MPYQVEGQQTDVFSADVDMSAAAAWQFTAVGIGKAQSTTGLANGGAALARASSSAPFIGVLQNAPKLGQRGIVMLGGISKVLLGEDVTVGLPLCVNEAGKFVICPEGTAPLGYATEDEVAGELGAAYLLPTAIPPSQQLGGTGGGSGSSFRFLKGTFDPDDTTGGHIGDVYLNTTTGVLFGPLAAGDAGTSQTTT